MKILKFKIGMGTLHILALFEARRDTALNRKLTVLGLVITGTSAPEFFTNIMGTFVTKSDLGIGTIVGSAVFNIFGVISVCGLFRSVG